MKLNRIIFALYLTIHLLPVKSYGQSGAIAVKELTVYGGNQSENFWPHTTVTDDGGFICCMTSLSTTGPIYDSFCHMFSGRIVFVKYRANGEREWYKCYNAGSSIGFFYLYPAAGGNFVLGGFDAAADKFVIRKEDAAGAQIWMRSYGGNGSEMPRSMVQTPDGGYIMAGESYSTDGDVGSHYGSAYRDIWVIKVDSNGNKVWSKVIGGTSDDQAATVLNAPHGGCYVIGSTMSTDFDCTGNHGSKEMYIARLDSGGNMVWHRDLGGSDEEHGSFACPDGRNGVYIAGHATSADGDVSHHLNAGLWNIWVADIDSAGVLVWNNCYGGGGGEHPNSICRGTDGSVWVVGSSLMQGGEVDTAYGSEDAFIVHADSAGNFLGSRVLGSTGWDRAEVISALTNGNVLCGGFYDNGDADFSMFTNYGNGDIFLSVLGPEMVSIRNPSAPSFQLYPNPATTGNVHISLPSGAPGVLQLFSISSRFVYQQHKENGLSSMEIQTDKYPAGMYIAVWNGTDGYIRNTKFVKLN